MIAVVRKAAEIQGLTGVDIKCAEVWRPAAQDDSLRLDHVGIAVQSITSSRPVYEALGMRVIAVETVEQERVRVAMLSLGGSRIELIEAMDEGSTIGRFLAKRGEGMHHIALYTDDIQAKFESQQAAGARLASDSIRVGAGGHRYFFIHPASTGGVLIEIVGDAAARIPVHAGERELE